MSDERGDDPSNRQVFLNLLIREGPRLLRGFASDVQRSLRDLRDGKAYRPTIDNDDTSVSPLRRVLRSLFGRR
jgi:hypothetical protein